MTKLQNCDRIYHRDQDYDSISGRLYCLKPRIAVNRTPMAATENHLPHEITQCYLPPDTRERAPT